LRSIAAFALMYSRRTPFAVPHNMANHLKLVDPSGNVVDLALSEEALGKKLAAGWSLCGEEQADGSIVSGEFVASPEDIVPPPVDAYADTVEMSVPVAPVLPARSMSVTLEDGWKGEDE